MSNTFDSIDHDILITKLRDVGLSCSSIEWFKSYLSLRSQVVKIQASISDQPLLFSIYTNDLSLVPKHCSTQSYVDDTKLLLNFWLKDQQNIVSKLNEDLQRICQWTFTNKLLLNPDKTKFVIFGSRPLVSKVEGLHLSILGKELTPAKSAKDLGVILNSNLTYNDHVTKTVSTCMSRLGQINRVKHVLDKDTLTIVVNCLVFSKLFYCSNVWSNTTESNLDKVQKVQNFACRIVSGVKKFDHITPVLRAMQWLPIRQLFYYRNAVMAFNCVTGCTPDSFTDQFIKRSDVSMRTTRNSQKLQIPLLKSATGQRSFYYRTVKIWNTLDPSLKLSKTLQEFKRKLKNFLLKDFMDRIT